MTKNNSTNLESPIWQRRLHGEVVFQEMIVDHDGAGRSTCEWRPSYQLSCQLPEWFRLQLECITQPNGFRLFVPIGVLSSRSEKSGFGLRYIEQLGGLTAVAAAGGATILEDRGVRPKEQRLTFRKAWLLQEHTRHRREYIGDSRQLLKELRICAAARRERSQNSILPCGFGIGANGLGRPWSLADVRRAGLEAARLKGIESPQHLDIVRLGLLEGTKLQPLRLKSAEVHSIVRQSIFIPTASVSRSQLTYVAEHFLANLDDAIDDDDPDALTRWIEDRDSSQPGMIEKLFDSKMDRDQVRAAIVELGWRATVMVAECVDAQFRVFRDALSEPLSPAENLLFEQTFLMNRWFFLPLAMLHDRLEFLHEAILDLWKNPDDRDAVGIVHGLLYVYSSMIENRREADRRIKQLAGGAKREVSSHAEGCDDQLAISSSSVWSPTQFSEIAVRVAEAAGYLCDFGNSQFEAHLSETQQPQRISFRLICADLSFDETIEVYQSQFEECARAYEKGE